MAQALGKMAPQLEGLPKICRESNKYKEARSFVYDYLKFRPGETGRVDQMKKDLGTGIMPVKLVSKQGVADFTGKTGNRLLGSRWVFGDHSVAIVDGTVHDPSFKFCGFPYTPEKMNEIYAEWWAETQPDDLAFGKVEYVDIGNVKPTFYQFATPYQPPRSGGLFRSAREAVPGEWSTRSTVTRASRPASGRRTHKIRGTIAFWMQLHEIGTGICAAKPVPWLCGSEVIPPDELKPIIR
jgi:hypothetical protein